jgi:hypothetical protein
VNLALPPISRTRARTGRAHDTEHDGAVGQGHLEDDGGPGDDSSDVVESARGGARRPREADAAARSGARARATIAERSDGAAARESWPLYRATADRTPAGAILRPVVPRAM